MANADISLQLFSDTRCGVCTRNVGVGVQCSLCHKWYHLAPDPEHEITNISSRHHHGSGGSSANQQMIPSASSLTQVASGGGMSMQSSMSMMGGGGGAATGGAPSLRSGESASVFASGGVASGVFSGITAPPAAAGAGAAGAYMCPGIEFPKFLPYFCSDCELRCAAADMARVTEIFNALLHEEKDEYANGAPVVLGNLTSSFVRKRVRAVVRGPLGSNTELNNNRNLPNSSSNGGGGGGGGDDNLNNSSLLAGSSILHDPTMVDFGSQQQQSHDFFDDTRTLEAQARWEKMFPRSTLAVLRRVLAPIYPQQYDDSAMLAAAKAARSKHAASSSSSRRRTTAASGSPLAPSLGAAAGGGASSASERRQEMLRQKFFAPISFVGPTLTMTEAEANTEENLERARRRHTAREQDIEMMDMQHEVTLHRLRWMPNEMGQHSDDVFGPQPVYVNPITSQIRLSEVVIEVGQDDRQSA